MTTGQNLKVMTYNIRLDLDSDAENSWTKRKDLWVSQVRFYSPDILGIQEARPNQVIDIASNLPAFAYVGIGRDENNSGESSNIFYKKDRFTVVRESTFWLSETPDQISKGWDAAINRICTYALLKDTFTNKQIWVFNTHLDHIGEVARTKGIELILSKIAKLNTGNDPVIFMGDLNSEPETQRITDLKTKMLDTRDISQEKPFGPAGTFNGFNHQKPVTELIDYIFISKFSNFEVKKYAILSDSVNLRYPSDHLPVYVEMSYN